MILIIGSNEEKHSKFLYEKIQKVNLDVAYFDSRLYPEELFLSYGVNNSENDDFIKTPSGKIYVKDIVGVWWRWFYGVKRQKFADDNDCLDDIVFRECKSALENLFSISSNNGCNWLNSLEAINLHQTKGYQLHLMNKAGIRVPKTLFTNNIDSVYEFWNQNNKNIIYKPVLGGAYTQKMSENDFTKEKLNALKYSPIQLQECIDGVDVRVYVVGNNIYAAKILSKTLDFREDFDAKIVPIELPDNIQKDCLKIMEILKLRYTGIDIRLSNSGEYVFIEANPAPMFIHFEKESGYPISDSLIKELIK